MRFESHFEESRDKVGKPQFEQKMQWAKQNVVHLSFLYFLPAVMPEGERKTVLNRIRIPQISFTSVFSRARRDGRSSCTLVLGPCLATDEASGSFCGRLH